MRNIKKITFLLFVAVIVLNACKKDSDTVTTQTIHGQVYNQCTDSGMANIKVYLTTSGQAISASSLSAISDANGNFSFVNAQIHSSNDYEYTFYIPSESGIGGTTAGFDAGTWGLDKSKLNISYTLGVVPHFLKLCHTSNITSPIISPDSFFVLFKQRKFSTQSLSSSYTYTLGTSSYNYPPGYSYCFQDYVMGLWNITIDKWKSGIHTTTYDSIYIGYGATKTYTINW